jgi:hypothetical protein
MATIVLKMSDGTTLPIATGLTDANPGALGTTRGDLNSMVANKLYYLDKGSYLLVRVGNKRALYLEKTFANQKLLNTYVVSFNEETSTIDLVPRNVSKMANFSEAYANIGFVYNFGTLTATEIDNTLQNSCNGYIYPVLGSALPSGWIA